MRNALKFIFFITLLIPALSAYSQKLYRIRGLDFTGNSILSEEVLLEQFNTVPRQKLNRLLFWKKKPEFALTVLKNDIDRLKSYYIRNGFIHPEISYSLDTIKHKKHINILVSILENEYVTVDSIHFKGSTDSLAQAIIAYSQTKIPLKQKQRFKDVDVFKTENILRQNFSNEGYPLLQTTYQILFDKQKKAVNVYFKVDPGNRSFFGDINITGDTLIPETFIRKRILLSKSDLYSQEKINKTQENIFDTDLFQYVIINAMKDSVVENNIPIEVIVKELPRYAFEGGVGYGTEDRLRLSGEMKRLSFLGGARRLILKGKTSYFVPLSIDLNFIQPDLFLNNLDFSFNPFFIREREQSYQIDRVGGGINFLYPLNKKIKVNLTYAIERDNLTELNDLQLDESELKHDKSILTVGSVYNSTNNRFYPRQGYKMDGTLSYAGLGFGHDIQYYQFQLSLRNYSALTENLILALRFKTGVIQNIQNSDETPIEERFYAGGASSLRGWTRHGISPVDQEGFAIGGNTLMEASAELRFPIYDIFGGVVFMDVGNVWSDSYQYSMASLHYNAGLGFRIKSPIGPIRLDMASPVIKDAFDFQFFISIGQTF
ncbi:MULTISPECIES: outer membrane protein assembly factor BamA [unclassified Saccharicrinis]|uniref:outer membrane protein assembly factor BamA n=1 Tax=unclassified Saccharicrinis TaxID=2646859 RepID=UPI003D353D94